LYFSIKSVSVLDLGGVGVSFCSDSESGSGLSSGLEVSTMISLLVYFVIILILLSFAYWVVGQLLPPPVQKFAYIVLALIGVIAVIWLLMTLVGGAGPGPIHLPVR
jgi:hypothetical protein